MIRPKSGIEVSKGNQFAGLVNYLEAGVELIVEFFNLIQVAHRRGITAD